jgi:predicted phage replisome organizer
MKEEKVKGRYFYLMLKENFYDSDDMVLLESMENGYKYSNILLKLYLRSLKDKGKLMYKDRIPYSIEMLAKLTRHDPDTVRRAIEIFRDMGIIEILDNGAIFMMDIENYIGKSSTEADRRRAYDRRIAAEKKELLLSNNSEKTCDNSCEKSHEHIDIELDTDININTDIKKDIKKEQKNIVIAKANDSVSSVSLEDEFNIIWSLYPRKQGKSNAFKAYIKARKKGITKETIYNGLQEYLNYIQIEKIKPQYIKQGSTWFNQECWNDDYSIKREVTTKDLAEHIDFSEFR